MAKTFSYTIDAIACVAATAKTLLELGTDANTPITIIDWWIDLDNTTSGAPGKIELQKFSAGITTGTSVTPVLARGIGGVSGVTLKHSATVEGAGTPTAGSGEIRRIPPTALLDKAYSLGREFELGVSGFWRLRATFAAAVNACVGIVWEE